MDLILIMVISFCMGAIGAYCMLLLTVKLGLTFVPTTKIEENESLEDRAMREHRTLYGDD